MFTDLKGSQLIYIFICQFLIALAIELLKFWPQLFFVSDLWIVKSTVHHQSDFVRRTWLDTSLKVALQELYALFMIKEPILIKLIHLFTHFDEDINLTRLRVEWEFRIRYFHHTRVDFLIFFVKKRPDCEADTHVFKLAILIDRFTFQKVLDFPHVTPGCQLIAESYLNAICYERTNSWWDLLHQRFLVFSNHTLIFVHWNNLRHIGLGQEISYFTALIIF